MQERRYPAALKDYHGNLILAGISYDKKTKRHSCLIEKLKPLMKQLSCFASCTKRLSRTVPFLYVRDSRFFIIFISGNTPIPAQTAYGSFVPAPTHCPCRLSQNGEADYNFLCVCYLRYAISTARFPVSSSLRASGWLQPT